MNLMELQTKLFTAIYDNKYDSNLFAGDENFQRERLAIYQTSILASRTAALSRLFPCCKKIVGDDYWQFLISAFIKKYPSKEADITASGADLSEFMTLHEVHTHVPYLADMAHLEWAWHLCFHEAKGEYYLKSYYPLDKLWAFCHAPQDATFLLDDLKVEHTFILYREHDSIIIKEVLPNYSGGQHAT